MRTLSLVLSALAVAIIVSRTVSATGSGTELGQTLAGDSCRLAGTSDIICGETKDSAGTLRVSQLAVALPDDPSQRHAFIVKSAKDLPGGLSTSEDVRCDSGKWLTAQGSDSVLFFCTLGSNNWPRLILVSASDHTLLTAEGLPAMLPVLEAALAAGGHRLDAIDAETASTLVHEKYSADILSVHSKEFAEYKRLIESARLYGGSDNYAGAEDAYRQTLEIETRVFGVDSLSVAQTVTELALQVSNQGRFDEAAALFRRATPIIEASSSAIVRARLASYQALDAANRRSFADALKYAREATDLRRAEVDAAKAASISPDATRAELSA